MKDKQPLKLAAYLIALIVLGRFLCAGNESTNLHQGTEYYADPRPVVWTTNKDVQVFSWDTNNVLKVFGRMIGTVQGTNYLPVPDVQALQKSHESGFGLGVHFGAIAAKRNPDVSDLTELINIAARLMQAEQQQQQQAQRPRK